MDNQAQNGFDLSILDSNEKVTHTVTVLFNPDGSPRSGFYMVGKNSEEYQQAAEKIRIEGIKRAAARKQQIDTSTDEGAATVVRAVAANDRTTALSVVTGWFGFMANGQEASFDKAVVEKMFNKYPQWQQKVLEDLEQESNFTMG